MLVANEDINQKTITDSNLIIDNFETINSAEIEFFPVQFDNRICIYAINNGNQDIKNADIEIGSTFNDIWDGEENIEICTTNKINCSLKYGEVKEILNFSIDDIKKIFGDRKQGWLHIFKFNDTNNIISFDKFICNIAYDEYTGFSVFINQGGGFVDNNYIPIFVNCDNNDSEVFAYHPKIEGEGIADLLFVFLPNRSGKFKFHLELKFSDDSEYESEVFEADIIVPIYEDENDYVQLIDAIIKSDSKRFIYGRGEVIESSFLYSPYKLYEEISSMSQLLNQ